MPEWFKALGIICLAVVMVVFLLGIAVSLILFATAVIEDWLEERREKQLYKKGRDI